MDCGVNILRLITDVKMYKKENEIKYKSAAIIFLDFSSAFDNVEWNELFRILKK